MMAENTEIDNDFIQIIDAETLDDMKMILTFSTDERRLFDAKKIDRSGIRTIEKRKIFQ